MPRRRPIPVPGGLYESSPETAVQWLRAPGVLLVVDGYNVAKLAWPDLSLPEQRERLLDALDELVLRLGPTTHVVFDGAEVEQLPRPRRNLKVEFSPAGVKADDVIVAVVAAAPVDRAVAVATNDQAVREACRALGANLLASDQLLMVVGRSA